MAKDKLTDYDATAANNTDVGGISVDEGMLPSNVNNAIREVMSHLKDFAAGTEAVDAIAVNGDLTVDTNTLHVDATNNRVGIGTSSPNRELHVSGLATVENTAGNGAFLIYPDSAVNKIYSRAGNATSTSLPFAIHMGSTERMRIESSGDVGIGTSSPASKLHVDGDIRYNGRLLPASTAADGTAGAPAIPVGYDYNTGFFRPAADTIGFSTTGSERMRITSSGNVGIGTTSPLGKLEVKGAGFVASHISSDSTSETQLRFNTNTAARISNQANTALIFDTNATERMRIDSLGHVYIGTTGFSILSSTDTGIALFNNGGAYFVRDSGSALQLGRQTNDGEIIGFWQAGSKEGSITVSGTTVSYNGGHLARWSQLTDGTKDETIVKGTVMTNLDQMAVWSHDAVEAQDAVYDEDGNVVTEAVEAKDAYTEDNEQLNCMAVSSVEGDANVAGVFVNWDDDDDEFNDMNIAMTGDMVIRIAQGTTVARGDLLMSAGDGTAKPQGDDIVRSKTIAKVTSTNVSHTYDDGSYLVPCVLMAC